MKTAVFLDRDGVINEYVKPVNKPEDLILFPWTASAIRRLNQDNHLVFIVTNQGGLELGYFTVQELDAIHNHLLSLLQAKKARIERIVYCPHFRTKCSCRKPEPGLLLQLAAEYGLNLSTSWMVGDRRTDILAGQAAGCRTIKIQAECEFPPQYSPAEFYCQNLQEAVDYILNFKNRSLVPLK